MIHGIGTDIVAVARLRGMWERHGERALDKLLAPQERADFAKALGTGIRPPATLTAMGVGHDELGKPILECYGRLAEMLENQQLKAHLSISDEAEYAVAYVILEQA